MLLSLIAEVVFAHLFCSKRGAEHVACLCDVVCCSIVETNLNLVIVEAVHVFPYFDARNQVTGIVLGDMVTLRQLFEFLLFAVFRYGLVAHLHFEYVSVDEVAAEQGQDGVRVVAPDFHGRPDVIVIKREVVLQTLRLMQESLPVNVIVKKEMQSWRGKEFQALPCQLLSSKKRIYHDVFCCDRGLVKIDLPIHEASADQIVFDRVDAFLVHDKLVVCNIKHVDDARTSDVSLVDSSKESVAFQVVETVHVEL